MPMCSDEFCTNEDYLFLDCNMNEAILASKYPQKWIKKKNREEFELWQKQLTKKSENQ